MIIMIIGAKHREFRTQVQTCSSNTRVGRARAKSRELHRRTVGLEYRSTIRLRALSSDRLFMLYSVEPLWTHPPTRPQLSWLVCSPCFKLPAYCPPPTHPPTARPSPPGDFVVFQMKMHDILGMEWRLVLLICLQSRPARGARGAGARRRAKAIS